MAAQKSGKNQDLAGLLETLLEDYLKRHDPLQKAQRSQDKSPKLCTVRVKEPQRVGRVRLKAQEKHAVINRDKGRCTFRDESGHRCANERWLHLHHIRPVSQGGGNNPENLITLCSFHHDLTHQLSLPIDGQVKTPQKLGFIPYI